MRDVFLSRPTVVDAPFEKAYAGFEKFIKKDGFRARRLGQTDFNSKPPLMAIIEIIDDCCGAIILGYPQLEFHHQVKRSTKIQASSGYVLPTPWNQIEGALAYRSHSPVMVVAHNGVSGGIFDYGVTGEFVLSVDLSAKDWFIQRPFRQLFTDWKKRVQVRDSTSGK